MFRLILYSLFLSEAFASGNYQRNQPSTPSVSTLSLQRREAKSIEEEILSWNRVGVSIDSVTVKGNKFFVVGSFSNRSDFQRFLLKIKGENAAIPRGTSVTENFTVFAGIKRYSFEIEAENAW